MPWADGKRRSEQLQVVCSDMWKAYLRVAAQRAGNTVRVVDRFHIMKKLGEAIDKVRAAEARERRARGAEPVLKNTRWLLLKWPENLTDKQLPRLAELVKLNLRTVRAYLLKEEFRQFFDCRSPTPGPQVPAALAAARPALQDRARHAIRRHPAAPRALDPELVPHRPLPLLGCCRRLAPQCQVGSQKSLRIPVLPSL